MPIDQEWKCRDGVCIAGDFFSADGARARLIIAPAMGIPRRFYRRLADWLADHGIEVIIFDYRATPGALMADWGRLDIDAVISGCSDERPLFLLGHSCGGQLAGLAPSVERLDGLIFMAAQSGYWAHWSGRGRVGMWPLSHALIPALARGVNFPAQRLGMFPIDVPASVISEWGRWIRRPRYLFAPDNPLDTDAYARLALPCLVCGSDDDGYAPATAIDALLREYSRLRVTERWQFRRGEHCAKAIGHMGFFRESMQASLWQPMADWILHTADARSALNADQT